MFERGFSIVLISRIFSQRSENAGTAVELFKQESCATAQSLDFPDPGLLYSSG